MKNREFAFNKPNEWSMRDDSLISEQHEILISLLTHSGQSLDSKVNCDHFLGALVQYLPIDHASIWVQSHRLADICGGRVCDFHVISQSAPQEITEGCIPEDSPVWEVLKDRKFYSFRTADTTFQYIRQERLPNEGTVVLCRLNTYGILKLFFVSQTTEEAEAILMPYLPALEQFTKSLAGSIAYEKLGWEIEERQFVERRLMQAQAESQERERLFRIISENAKDVICLHQPNGDFVYISPAITRLLGYKPQEMMMKKIWDVVHPEDHGFLQNLKARINGGQSGVNDIQSRIKNAKGEYVWMETSIKPILDENGSLQQFQTLSRDITFRKEAETALIEAKNKAEEASKAKADFLSTMSHEIRTPMNAVIGLTHILLQENPREDQVEALSTLHFSAENLLSLINDILDFSKIEAGKINMEYRPLQLKALLRGIVQTFEPKASDKNILLSLSVDQKIPEWVISDQVRLSQVLNNLMGNAIKFTSKGGVKLIVDAEHITEHQARLHFRVRDTGIGIPEDKQRNIFDRFTQASTSTTRKYGGTGLGLAITKRLLSMMESEIQLSSVLGEGSEFHFYMDFKLPKAETTSTNGRKKGDHTSDFLQGLKVLVAEDNRVNRMIVGRFLKKWKIRADFVENGVEAVEKAQADMYDVILMDLHMPEMDGMEATRLIKEQDVHNREIPIIALTASTMTEDRTAAASVGMIDYIAKPFDPTDLFSKLNKYAPENITLATRLQKG
ncbi:MAG: response regulator [Bacteroidota bacterium]